MRPTRARARARARTSTALRVRAPGDEKQAGCEQEERRLTDAALLSAHGSDRRAFQN